MLHKLIRGLAPLAAIAVGASLSGCDGSSFTINGEKAVPLADLDLTGNPPHSVVLAGPDTVILRDGDRMAITVDGDPEAVERVRFALSEDTLAITRENGTPRPSGRATVRITMPSPRALTIAGSGTLEAQSLSGGEGDINVLGSGRLVIDRIAADKLSVNVAGSGTLTGSGTAERLDMNLLGSGEAGLEGLSAQRAKLTIAGSGSAIFASDGEVNAEVMGSGAVTIVGRATCTVKSMGSGKVTCRPASEATSASQADDKPKRSARKGGKKDTRRQA